VQFYSLVPALRLLMTMPPPPYDLAKAVRAARRKRVDELQLGTAHPRSHGRQHADDKAAADADGPVQRSEAGATTPHVERLERLVREHGHQRSADEPKPWKKPWDK
jgi:hypothetical protein